MHFSWFSSNNVSEFLNHARFLADENFWKKDKLMMHLQTGRGSIQQIFLLLKVGFGGVELFPLCVACKAAQQFPIEWKSFSPKFQFSRLKAVKSSLRHFLNVKKKILRNAGHWPEIKRRRNSCICLWGALRCLKNVISRSAVRGSWSLGNELTAWWSSRILQSKAD